MSCWTSLFAYEIYETYMKKEYFTNFNITKLHFIDILHMFQSFVIEYT